MKGENIMIKALKEYKDEVLKPEIAWLKRHWIGVFSVFGNMLYYGVCINDGT